MRWRIYEMRCLTTLTMLRGQIVHGVIAGALRSIRYGQSVTPKMVKESVTALIREQYGESARKLWHIDNRPPGRKLSSITSLVEHYYNLPNMNERARDAQQVAWLCVENLISSDFWKEIAEGSPSTWAEIEEESFPSFDIDGIQVYTKIDFAHSNGKNTIIDWKTGASNEQDRKQLILYSMYAKAKWEWEPCETTLAAVYLQPELKVEQFSPTEDEIAQVRAGVKESFQQMMDVEPAYGPADVANFPIAESRRDCAWCRFQGICEGRVLSSEF